MIPKIHLLMSVYLTDVPLSDLGIYSISKSPNQNKAEQLLSTIHSLKSIEFNSADIYFDVSGDYDKFVELIFEQIKIWIPNANIHKKRLEFFSDWKKSSVDIPFDSEAVLLKTNHDHVFTHDDASAFYKFIQDLNSFGQEYVGEISHWPESIGNLRSGSWQNLKNNYYYTTEATRTIGTCIIRPDFFKSWWVEDFTGGSRIVRPDNPFGPWVEFAPITRVVPTCEFFRHMDGYGYAKINALIASPLRACCTVAENSVKHIDWTKGSFFHGQKDFDLPNEPKIFEINSITTLLNLALLSCAYKVNFKNLWHLHRSFKFRFQKFSFVFLSLCFTDKFFLRKTINLFLPIYDGNTKLFSSRMFFVRCYKRLSERYNLPPSIRQFLRFRI